MSGLTIALAWVVLNMNPMGIRETDLCRAVGIDPLRVDGLLLKMETMGYLTSEDDGKVYPYGMVDGKKRFDMEVL